LTLKKEGKVLKREPNKGKQINKNLNKIKLASPSFLCSVEFGRSSPIVVGQMKNLNYFSPSILDGTLVLVLLSDLQ
jgi:hypothetical protein